MNETEISTQGEIIAVDGKTVRSSYDKKSKQGAIDMVSAVVTENGVVLSQVKTYEKSNEINAISDLLSKLYIKGNSNVVFLAKFQFMTLVPSTIPLKKQSISKAVLANKWIGIDDNYQYIIEEVNHMKIKQRWMTIYSKAANSRAKKALFDKLSEHIQV
jgi:predicted transposase YbfD/YdcC